MWLIFMEVQRSSFGVKAVGLRQCSVPSEGQAWYVVWRVSFSDEKGVRDRIGTWYEFLPGENSHVAVLGNAFCFSFSLHLYLKICEKV